MPDFHQKAVLLRKERSSSSPSYRLHVSVCVADTDVNCFRSEEFVPPPASFLPTTHSHTRSPHVLTTATKSGPSFLILSLILCLLFQDLKIFTHIHSHRETEEEADSGTRESLSPFFFEQRNLFLPSLVLDIWSPDLSTHKSKRRFRQKRRRMGTKTSKQQEKKKGLCFLCNTFDASPCARIPGSMENQGFYFLAISSRVLVFLRLEERVRGQTKIQTHTAISACTRNQTPESGDRRENRIVFFFFSRTTVRERVRDTERVTDMYTQTGRSRDTSVSL